MTDGREVEPDFEAFCACLHRHQVDFLIVGSEAVAVHGAPRYSLDVDVPLDIALGAMPFEERCITRASPFGIGEGQALLTCSAEDLVIFKAFAGRERDWLDIETIIERQREALDAQVIWAELVPLLELKGDAATEARVQRLPKKGRRQA